MNSKRDGRLWIASACVVGLACLTWLLTPGASNEDRGAAKPAAVDHTQIDPELAEISWTPEAERRANKGVAFDSKPAGQPGVSDDIATAGFVEGSVQDLQGRPLESVEVEYQTSAGPTTSVTTDADGTVRLPFEGRGRLVSKSPNWMTLYSGLIRSRASQPLLVLGRPIQFEGQVLSTAQHLPVESCSVLWVPGSDVLAGIAGPLQDSALLSVRVHTDFLGEFEIRNVPDLRSGSLVFEAEGYVSRVMDLSEFSENPRVILLTPSQAPHLSGVVLNERAETVAGASVSFGGPSTSTDRRGQFRLETTELSEWPSDRPLVVRAVAPGYGAGKSILGTGASWNAQESSWIEIRLQSAAYFLHGHVEASSGKRLEGIELHVRESEPFGWMELEATDLLPFPHFIEVGLLESLAGSLTTQTTAGGSFELGPFPQQTLDVTLFDRASMRRAGPFALDPGARGHNLVFEGDPPSILAGWIVHHGGEPAANANVTLISASGYGRGPSVWTDSSGAFRFESVSTQDPVLMVDGPDIFTSSEIRPNPNTNLQRWLIEVDRPASIQFEFQTSQSDNWWLELRDPDGLPQSLMVRVGDAWRESMRVPAIAGQSEVFTTPAGAASAVLLDERDEVLSEISIDPKPGELQQIEIAPSPNPAE